jgi:DNA-binding beta-propeller fold protein YncE
MRPPRSANARAGQVPATLRGDGLVAALFALFALSATAATFDTPADSTVSAGAGSGSDSVSAGLPLEFERVGEVMSHGDGRGQVLEPAGVACDAFGRVYVSDAALHRLQRVDAAGRFLGEAGGLGSDPGELRRPGSVALLGALGVAVLDRENRRVVAYDLFGRFTGIVVDLEADALADEIGRVDPIAMATDRGGALYVADTDRDRLLAFDFSGRYLRTIGGFGAKPGSFRGLSGVAVAPNGSLITVERGARRIQRLDAGGRPLVAWPIDLGRASATLAVAVDDSGRVALADAAADSLWLFAPGGTRLAARGGVDAPHALAFAPDGTLLVAEAGRVTRFAVRRAGRTPAARDD